MVHMQQLMNNTALQNKRKTKHAQTLIDPAQRILCTYPGLAWAVGIITRSLMLT